MKSKTIRSHFRGSERSGRSGLRASLFCGHLPRRSKNDGRGGRGAVPVPEPSFLPAVATKDAKTGKTITWAVEWGGGGQLGARASSAKPCDRATMSSSSASPDANPEAHRLRMISIKRPSDGWSWGGTFD